MARTPEEKARDEEFSIISDNEKYIDNNLRRAERLRQSILKKAFSGKLVTGNAKHCKGNL